LWIVSTDSSSAELVEQIAWICDPDSGGIRLGQVDDGDARRPKRAHGTGEAVRFRVWRQTIREHRTTPWNSGRHVA
jgi:hypothetical protein